MLAIRVILLVLETTDQKIAERIYWHNIANDVSDYLKKCDKCQKYKAMPIVISQVAITRDGGGRGGRGVSSDNF